jgi:acyl-CoA synthetase (NDP forming)
MPDLGALLWPRTVALIGASASAESLRGRIFNVMRSHAFAGQLYPVSRSSAEVLGLKAYPSVADLPQPADLAVIIIPAKHVPEELERCGKAGVKSAVVLSSGFAEAVGEEGSEMQAEIRAIAQRYGMAVMGPNSEGFANIAANLCPTFSPAMEAGERPLVPAGRPRPQLAVAAQSGGIGFAMAAPRSCRSATSSPPATRPAWRRSTSPTSSSTRARPTHCCCCWRTSRALRPSGAWPRRP